MKNINVEIKDTLIMFAIPIIISVIVCWIIKIPNDIEINNLTEILTTMMSLWATLLGFLVTACTILLGLGNNEYIKFMKDSGDYRGVLKCVIISCFILFLSLAIGCFFLLNTMKIHVLYIFLVGTIVMTLVSVALSLLYLLIAILKATQ